MFKKLNKKGFTLAELLVVVAIIGVLVAISIPIFTSQLEKSREAVDAANARAAYAEMMAAAITGGYTADATIATTDSYTVKYTKASNTYTATISLKQTQPDWQGTVPSIGGLTTTTKPAANGTCEITCVIGADDAETVSIDWNKTTA